MENETQKKLFEEELDFSTSKETFFMYYKSVSEDNLKSEMEFTRKYKNSLLLIVDSLSSNKYLEFDKFKMKKNCKEWVESLLDKHDSKIISYLLNDFSDSMNTNMREKDMYVISILTDDKLLIAHSRMGEKSISPDFEIFDRMLDKDNVMRYVLFENKNDKILVRHFEKNKSKFFREWLGISGKDHFYDFGGENKFYLEYNNLNFVLELKDEELDDIMNSKDLLINKNTINFSNPINGFTISHIKRSSNKYEDFNQFNKDFTARKFDFRRYQKSYKNIINSLNSLIYKVYDCQYEVLIGKEVYESKDNTNLDILFCNSNIEICEEYLQKLKLYMLNNEERNIAHAGLDLTNDFISIGKFKILNKVDLNMSKILIDYYNNNDLSNSFKKELLCAIFSCLLIDNRDNVLYYFFKSMLNNLCIDLDFNSTLTEDELIEVKGNEFLSGTNDTIVEKISSDILKKLSESNCKLYYLGYNEENKQYEPLSSQKFDDSRIESLTKQIKDKTKLKYIKFTKLNLNDNKCIFLLVVKKD